MIYHLVTRLRIVSKFEAPVVGTGNNSDAFKTAEVVYASCIFGLYKNAKREECYSVGWLETK